MTEEVRLVRHQFVEAAVDARSSQPPNSPDRRRSPIALCSNHNRCSRHSLRDQSGDNKPASGGCGANTCLLENSGKRLAQNPSSPSCSYSTHANQHAPHWRGRCSCIRSSRTCTPYPLAWSGTARSAGNKANCLGCRSFVEGFNNLAPCLALAIIDLAEVQYIALYHFAAGTSLALDNIPISMCSLPSF